MTKMIKLVKQNFQTIAILGTLVAFDKSNVKLLKKESGQTTVEWVGLLGGVAGLIYVVAKYLKGDAASTIEQYVTKAIQSAFQ